jgi:hypothetical protein
MTRPNHDLLSSIEIGVIIQKTEAEKPLHELDATEPLVVSIAYGSEELTLQTGSEFDIFKPRLESGIFKCIPWLNGSFFGGW